MTTVIYHGGCDDGFGAALAAWLRFGDDAQYVPGFYGEAPPVVTDEYVYILDFSYPREVMENMGKSAKKIVLLDHHKTAALALEDLSLSCDSMISFDMSRSGALMAWDFFFPTELRPRLLRHIDDNDRWQFKLPFTKFVIRNLRSYPHDFRTWKSIMANLDDEEFYRAFVAEGEAQERFFQSQLNFLFETTKPQPVWLGGFEGLAINASQMFFSDAGHRLAEMSGTFGLVYNILGNGIVACSLRSTGDFDVGEIAYSWGGGGHKNAAGFETTRNALMHLLSALPLMSDDV